MGLGEIILIVIVALLFIGPEKLPEAAKSISKGIRDIRKQTRELRETIEDDTEFGGAIRDLQSALRGDDLNPAVQARRKAAAALQKAVSLPAPEATAASSAAPASSSALASAGAPAAAPVIAASAGAIARGTAEPAAPRPEGGDSTASAESTSGESGQATSAPGHAHG
jgi:sec-independent protein translocase protein TatB